MDSVIFRISEDRVLIRKCALNHMMEWNHIVPGLKEAMISAVNSNDWSAVRGYIENLLPKDSVEYTQLQQIPIRNIYCNIIRKSCVRGFTELVNIFLNNGFPVDYIVDGYETMLHLAASEGHLSLVKLLINSGANINKMSNFGESPLYSAIQQGHLDVVNYLLIAGADINTVSKYGGTALQLAASNDNIPVMELLIKNGADVNIANSKTGDTALHEAMFSRSFQSVKFLLEHGSLINSIANNRATPLSISIQVGMFDIAMLLINSGADLNLHIHDTVLNKALYKGARIQLIECLLEHGANVTTVYYNKTALQAVISYTNYSSDEPLKIAKLLLIYGSNHYAEDDEGNTLLHWACIMGDLELVKYLIDYGLNVDAKNRYGEKPYDIATEKGHTNIVKAIIHYHCNKYTSF